MLLALAQIQMKERPEENLQQSLCRPELYA